MASDQPSRLNARASPALLPSVTVSAPLMQLAIDEDRRGAEAE